MKKLLQLTLTRPVLWLAKKLSSRPKAARVFAALSALKEKVVSQNDKRGIVLNFNHSDRFIIFSDQHKGARDLADDFTHAEKNYLEALAWYEREKYTFISLGDAEELWENTLSEVKKHNKAAFEAERKFVERGAFFKVFGNHDLHWGNDPLAPGQLKEIYGVKVPIYEGLILRTNLPAGSLDILLTHGHQGDMQSDGNWFSKWFVSKIWARLQAMLEINPNTPAYDNALKCVHNQLMYEWSIGQRNLALITGHTHQPVFNSLTYLERLYLELEEAVKKDDVNAAERLNKALKERIHRGETVPTFKAYKPNYFNSGCCCFSDGDITGIEIEKGIIKLVKWKYKNVNTASVREELEKAPLDQLLEKINN